jgi:hypothetical protein
VFQPSGFSKGSSLNVAVSWFWYPRDLWSFDASCRQTPAYADFHSEDQFRRAIELLVDQAVDAIEVYRSCYGTLHAAYETQSRIDASLTAPDEILEGRPRPGSWPELNLGILAGLNGEAEEARKLLRRVVDEEIGYEWQAAQRAYCEKAIDRIDDVVALRAWIEACIAACREMRGLPPLEGPALPDR